MTQKKKEEQPVENLGDVKVQLNRQKTLCDEYRVELTTHKKRTSGYDETLRRLQECIRLKNILEDKYNSMLEEA